MEELQVAREHIQVAYLHMANRLASSAFLTWRENVATMLEQRELLQ